MIPELSQNSRKPAEILIKRWNFNGIAAISIDPIWHFLEKPSEFTKFADQLVSRRWHSDSLWKDIRVLQELILDPHAIDTLEDKQELSDDCVLIHVTLGTWEA